MNKLGIGSYFIIEEVLKSKKDSLNSILDKYGKNKLFFDSGRSCLRVIADLSENKTVLLPDYLCDSIIQPFKEREYKCIYYKINDKLEPIVETINTETKVGIFVHLGYFGKTTSKKIEDKIDLLRKNGTIIIEDISHSIFSDSGSPFLSDYYICSIRKWIGIPDGGVLITNNEIEKNYSLQKNKRIVNSYLNGSKIKRDSKYSGSKEYLIHFKNAEISLDNNNSSFKISSISGYILKNYDFKRMIEIRRLNGKFLSKELIKMDFSTIEFDFTKETPLVIPLFFKNCIERNIFREKLINNNIFPPVHWPKPEGNKIESNLYDIELSIPCDQRYSINDMKNIINILKRIREGE